MEIFNVIHPSLDKMNRWITENQNNLQQKNEKEVQNETVNVRSRDQGDLGEMNLEQFVKSLEPYHK